MATKGKEPKTKQTAQASPCHDYVEIDREAWLKELYKIELGAECLGNLAHKLILELECEPCGPKGEVMKECLVRKTAFPSPSV